MNTDKPTGTGTKRRRNWLRDLGMGLAGLIAIIYLLNPDAGLIELIPDNIPVIGNLDEVAATILLIRVLGHFGWNPLRRRRGAENGEGENG